MDLRAAFAEEFGRAPEGIWSAPGRVNLIGEHTDYNGGLALPIALPQRTYAVATRRDDGRLRMRSLQTGERVEVSLQEIGPGRPDGWAAYAAGVVWALQRAGYAVGGADLLLDGRVPLGAGLSSSAALECATGAAMSGLYELGLLDSPEGRAALAAVCRRAENDIAQAPTGGMDQAASLLCTPGHALLLDCRSSRTELVRFDLDSAGLALLVIDTRAHHALVDGQYGARRASCERAAAALGVAELREIAPADLDDALARIQDGLRGAGDAGGSERDAAGADAEHADVIARRVRHVVTEIARVEAAVTAIEAGDWLGVGALFDASHASLRDDYEVSCPELDLACETALAHGALGARMTGGGFGGSAIALVPGELHDAIATTVAESFAAAGFDAPHVFTVVASDGAARDE